MNFYGIEYLQAQSALSDYLKYLLIFSTLSVLIVVFILYMRHRLQTKYRDLTIIAFLFLIFISGVQYADYTNSENIHSQSSQMVNLVRLLAKEKNVSVNDVFSDSVQLSDGVIIKIDNKYYRVNLNADLNSYSLTETWLTNPTVNIIK
ncbi:MULTISPECIES: DUF3290 domain-containing protein [Tatumella]|uniref:DUF3290 domain-containing protein n=1 Tax=Tatumella punctata TaxID=399969 RepID=A0ABW1VHB9_9GAMM|nr:MULTISPECIES: DUF3290 domain-containing protein [unclassified Tatumella]MBS0878910.1 DUF3290 domain-containing protein [Tatumella sp. JGM82]MBS0891902.1 DUF3290 domain-containing protein [Tatumella sp. JGM94]MBS0902696.1 DUF3290 domain-containing protein [Tatumella sp. JGM100]